MKKIFFITLKFLLPLTLIIAGTWWGWNRWQAYTQRVTVLKKIIERLNADTPVAEVIVTDVFFDEQTQQHMTKIKFLEYDATSQPLSPKYFTFPGNVIQFQSLVVRFKDIHIEAAHHLKEHSAYIFWKAYVLDGENTLEYEINPMYGVPDGYKLEGEFAAYETQLWKHFWQYALDQKMQDQMGIKNAQIEAPGTKFIPGLIYTLKIEHDGGLRIDAQPLSEILKGETIMP